MSADSIPGYELLTRVSDGSVRSYHALSRTGAVVMVHFLDEAGEAAARATIMIERLSPQERRKVLEVTPAGDGLVVVTKFILDFDSFFAWLAERVPEIPPLAPSPEPAAAVVEEEEPGEFTKAFRALGGTPAPEAESASPAVAPELPPGQLPSSAITAEPGEFTRAFRAVTGDPAVPHPGDLAGSAAGAASSGPETLPASLPEPPGLPAEEIPFDPETSRGPAEPVGLADPGSGPGEFTRMFGAISTPPVEPLADTAASAGSSPPRGAPAGAPDPGGPLPAPGTLPAPNLAGAPVPEDSAPPTVRAPALRWTDPAAAPVEEPAPGPPPSSGPGDFTRMFGKVVVPSSPESPILPGPPPAGAEYRAPANPGVPSAAPRSGATGDDYLSRLGGRGPTIEPVSSPGSPPVPPAVPPAPGGPAIPPWLGGGSLDGSLTPPPSAGPSEFTRVISAMTPPPAPPAIPAPSPAVQAPAIPPVAPAPAPASARPTLLLAGIALVVVLLIAVILFFVLRPPAADSIEGGDATPVETTG